MIIIFTESKILNELILEMIIIGSILSEIMIDRKSIYLWSLD